MSTSDFIFMMVSQVLIGATWIFVCHSKFADNAHSTPATPDKDDEHFDPVKINEYRIKSIYRDLESAKLKNDGDDKYLN